MEEVKEEKSMTYDMISCLSRIKVGKDNLSAENKYRRNKRRKRG